MSQAETKNYLVVEDTTLEMLPSREARPSATLEAIPISVVSNSHLLREGLFALLAVRLNLQPTGAYSGTVCPDILLPNPPGHIVLIDSGLGRAETVLWISYWHGLRPSARVLILELADELGFILECIEAGVSGYTLQGASISEVSEAIATVVLGLAYSPPKITAQLFAHLTVLRASIAAATTPLVTTRELEVLQHIAMGCSNVEIAAQLSVALPTVKQHVHHILRKLNIRSRAEAARFASEQGWLAPHQPPPMNQITDSFYASSTPLEMHKQMHFAAHER